VFGRGFPDITQLWSKSMKFIALVMLLASAGVFSTGDPEAFIPGIAFFGAGMWLLTRRPRVELPPVAPDVASRLGMLEREVQLLAQELARAKEDLAELTEERGFLRKLYSGGSVTSKTVGLPSA